MMPAEYQTVHECDDLRAECRRGWSKTALALVGLAMTVALASVGFGISQVAMNVRQDSQIQAHEKALDRIDSKLDTILNRMSQGGRP